MPATNYFEAIVLENALLQKPFSIQNWYVGLWLSDPTSAGVLATEVTAADYQRKPVSWSPAFGNLSQIDWAAPTSNWGSVTYMALTNSPLKGNGNVLIYEPTGTSFSVTIGRPLFIPAGGLKVDVI